MAKIFISLRWRTQKEGDALESQKGDMGDQELSFDWTNCRLYTPIFYNWRYNKAGLTCA